MRVIAGTYRSRPLVAPRGSATRPTSDRLRETLFNVLAARVPGARVMDLYCGTGAVGIEALSRGAEHVLFVESAAAAERVLRQNLRRLGIAGGFEVAARPVEAALRRLLSIGAGARPYDLVFLDPPYESAAEYLSTMELLGSRAGARLLTDEVSVIAEHASRHPLQERYGELVRSRVLRQGDAALSFYSRRPPRQEESSGGPGAHLEAETPSLR